MVDSASGLKIWTNQSYYFAGQTLKGAVLLDSSVTPNEEITFRFKGVDDCISWSRYVKNNRRFLQSDQVENTFFEVKLPLVKFDSQNCPKAKTAFPFSLVLPADLPQSICANSAKIKGLRGRCRYVMSVTLHEAKTVKMLSEQEI